MGDSIGQLPMLCRRLVCSSVVAWVVLESIAIGGSRQGAQQATGSLDQAIELVRDGRFAEAESGLRALLGEELSNGVAHMYLALAILRQEEAEGPPSVWHAKPSRLRMRQVERHSARALQLEPNLVAARLTRAIARAWLEEWPSAKEDLETAHQLLPDDDEHQELVKELLGQANEELKSWELTLSLGSAYDTNVPQIGRNVVIPFEFGRRKDYRFGASVDMNYLPYIGDRSEVGVGGGAYASWHCDLDVFDEQTYRGHAYVRHRAEDWLDLALRYDYDFNLLGREGYLSRHRLTPQLSVLEDFWGRTTLYYQFEPRRFYDVPAVVSAPPFDRTGDLHTLGISQAIVLGQLCERDVLFEIGYRHENVSTKGTEYDSRNEVLAAGLSVPLPWDMTFEFAAEWAWEDYKHRSTLDYANRGRDDLVQTYVFSLIKELNENVKLQGQILWIDDDSNVLTQGGEAVFSYDRVVYGLSLSVEF